MKPPPYKPCACFNGLRTLAILLTMVASPSLKAQFTDQSEMLGILSTAPSGYNGSGMSVFDFNQDGWDDISIGRGTQGPIFLVNNEGVFEPAGFVIPNANNRLINMILWSDYDADGDMDLLITKFLGPVELWQNDGDFNFTEVALVSGLLPGNYNHLGAAYCDFDHDGDLDLYIAKFYHPNFNTGNQYAGALYKNNGDGTFIDMTEELGVYLNPRTIFQPVFLDYDNDGWEDLYLITDRIFSENTLFRNNGDGTFINVTQESGTGIMICAMTGTVGDHDNDGDLDIYVTNGPAGSKFLNNNGNGTFSEMAAALGITASGHTGWGSLWIDYDNDGFQDLFVGKTTNTLPTFPGNRFFKNEGGVAFTQMIQEVGLLNDIIETYVVAMGDFNRDGYNDIVLNNEVGYFPKLYMNMGGANHHLSVSLRGIVSNSQGIGSWIKCYADGQAYVRFSLSGENLIGQNPNRFIFGLSDAPQVDSLVVEWNSGQRDVLYNLEVNQHLEVVEGMSQYYNGFVDAVFEFPPLCAGDSIEIGFSQFDSYQWSTGQQGPTLMVYEAGVYQAFGVTPWGDTISSAPVSITEAPLFEPGFDIQHETCEGLNNASIGLYSIMPDVDFSVSWEDGSETALLDSLSPGVYAYNILDMYGCLYQDHIEVNAAEPIIPLLFTNHVLCAGDSTGIASTFIFGGSPPYNLDWDGNNPEALPTGAFFLTITDALGCDEQLDFVIEEPDSLYIDLLFGNIVDDTGGNAEIWINGGVSPYQIFWSNGEINTLVIFNLEAGNYEVEVIDNNGCTRMNQFAIYSTLESRSWTLDQCRLFPNPASSMLYVEGIKQPYFDYTLFDLAGRIHMHKNEHISTKPIDTIGLSQGNYLLKIATDQDLVMRRFVKIE